MTKRKGWLIALTYLFLLFQSCQDSSTLNEKLTPLDPNLSTNLIRFEKELQALPGDNPLQEFQQTLLLRYPSFSELYVQRIVEAENNQELIEELELTRTDTGYLHLYHEVDSIFGELEDIHLQINQTLENYIYLFNLPISFVPDIYTFISGFAYQAFLFQDGEKEGIGLGLDMFLGSDFPYQQIHPANALFSNYLVRTYNKEHIVRKIADVLVEDKLIAPAKSDFLHLMIWGGKKLYLIDQILNFVPDSIVTEYTQSQLEWCQNNEAQMWQYFFEEDLFYETDLRKFNNLIAPAPTSSGMPKESPGQTGNYIGWKIVQSYMKRFPETTIRDLILFQDAQKLLELSRFKPERL